MGELREISDLEQAFFELEKIKRQVNALSDFLSAKILSNRPHPQVITRKMEVVFLLRNLYVLATKPLLFLLQF